MDKQHAKRYNSTNSKKQKGSKHYHDVGVIDMTVLDATQKTHQAPTTNRRLARLRELASMSEQELSQMSLVELNKQIGVKPAFGRSLIDLYREGK